MPGLGQDQGVDLFGTGLLEDLGAFVECGAGCSDVIDQAHAAVSDRVEPFDCKGIMHISASLCQTGHIGLNAGGSDSR